MEPPGHAQGWGVQTCSAQILALRETERGNAGLEQTEWPPECHY